MKGSKAFDMCYHLIKDHIAQKQFNLSWQAGPFIRADFLPSTIHLLITKKCAHNIFTFLNLQLFLHMREGVFLHPE